MNRRVLLSSAATAAIVPTSLLARQSVATPEASPIEPEIEQDTTNRDLVRTLSQISPVTFLEALEKAPVTNEILLAIGGEETTSVPWTDFGDTDLYNSLGGVGLISGEGSLSDPDTSMIGAYIVYESAEIAYHEVARKLGDVYDNPSMTTSAAGTNFYVIESDELQIAVGRVGYVMMMGLMEAGNEPGGEVMVGMMRHLAEVAETLA